MAVMQIVTASITSFLMSQWEIWALARLRLASPEMDETCHGEVDMCV